MEIKKLNVNLSVCKVVDYYKVDWNDEFLFIGKTDEENSLVCSTNSLPSNVIECENDWKGFRIQGVLDFSLVGILAKISTLLANNGVAIYAISTYNTDYILVKGNMQDIALEVLASNNYTVIE